jgi:alkaline phosphatase
MKSTIVATIVALVVCSHSTAQVPKNVILIVGDGTGPAHYTAAKILRGNDFQIGRMPVVGLATTSAANANVTDSAAAASALATGFKTNDEAVSIDPTTGADRETVLEAAERAGKATGIVTTAEFFDATPAAFASHAKDRHDDWLEMVREMLASGTEFIVGGAGGTVFGRDGAPSLEELASRSGFTLVRTRAALEASKAPHVIAALPTQLRNVDFPEAPLPDLARWAIARVKDDPDGFFLLIEHEGTDSSSHQNNTADLRASLVSLDKTVGVALDFAMNRNDTLVVVTGDHETGGLRITETRSLRRPQYEWATIGHTAVAVPIFAYGPGSAAFGKFMDNTDIGKRLLEYVRKP